MTAFIGRREFITLLGGAAGRGRWGCARSRASGWSECSATRAPGTRTTALCGRVPWGAAGSGFCGEPKRRDRIPFRGKSIRPAAGIGGRSGWPSGGLDCSEWPLQATWDGEGGNRNDSDRLHGQGSIRSKVGLVATSKLTGW